MITDEQAKKMLESIELSGAADEANATVRHIIVGLTDNGFVPHILTLSSGLPKIRTDKAKQFHLILSQPIALAAMSNLRIRCCLCKRVISYPAWYYSIKYNVNHLHFFICFDSNSSTKPNTKCHRKG